MPASSNPANAVRTAAERLVGRENNEFRKGKGAGGTVVYGRKRDPDDMPF